MKKIDAIYARYSSHAQDESTSIEVQIEQCERAAGAACEHYIDRAKTGRSVGGRIELIRLLADAESGRIGRVFVYKFDRLGRAAETHVVAQQLDDAGVSLISATEGTNALARGIQLVVAADYSRALAERTRDGLIKRFEQNGFTGGVAPYGYQVETREGRRVLTINDVEAEVVREISRMYLNEAVGFKSIAKRLRDRGIVTRGGAGWCFTSVRCLLLNPVLTGKMRFNARRMQLDRKTGKRVPRFRSVAEQFSRQDEALRILSDEDFERVQLQLASARRGTARTNRFIAPFTGLVYCTCGAKCYRVKSQNKKGSYDYYVCSRHLRYEDCPHSARVREDRLQAIVKERFARIFKHRDRIVARATEIAMDAVKSNRGQADQLKAQLAEVEVRQVRLCELLMDRTIADASKQTINRQMVEAESQRTAIQASLDGLRENANDNAEELAEMIREAFEQAGDSLAAASTPEQYNRVVEQYVGQIEVSGTGDISAKKLPAADATGNPSPIGCIAGGRYEPYTVIRSAWWAAQAA